MPGPERSFVVTGGAGGIGRVITARLDGHVVVLDVVNGEDAADEAVAADAAARAEAVAPLAGWVNNAVVFGTRGCTPRRTCSS